MIPRNHYGKIGGKRFFFKTGKFHQWEHMFPLPVMKEKSRMGLPAWGTPFPVKVISERPTISS
jgi:hypothetical protein